MKVACAFFLVSSLHAIAASALDAPLDIGIDKVRTMPAFSRYVDSLELGVHADAIRSAFSTIVVAIDTAPSPKLTQADANNALVIMLNGLTPRQLILLGHLFEAHTMAVDSGTGLEPVVDEKTRELQRSLGRWRRIAATGMLLSYSKTANKPPEPTPTAVTPRAGEGKTK